MTTSTFTSTSVIRQTVQGTRKAVIITATNTVTSTVLWFRNMLQIHVLIKQMQHKHIIQRYTKASADMLPITTCILIYAED